LSRFVTPDFPLSRSKKKTLTHSPPLFVTLFFLRHTLSYLVAKNVCHHTTHPPSHTHTPHRHNFLSHTFLSPLSRNISLTVATLPLWYLLCSDFSRIFPIETKIYIATSTRLSLDTSSTIQHTHTRHTPTVHIWQSTHTTARQHSHLRMWEQYDFHWTPHHIISCGDLTTHHREGINKTQRSVTNLWI
jgi:hypothetical protein